jgi:hypothetical protein
MTQPLGLGQFPYSQVAEWLAQGEIVPFVGSGASIAGVTTPKPLPDGRGLAAELAGKMQGAFPPGEQRDLPQVAQFFERSVFDRDALYGYLHQRFESEQQDTSPGAVARLLAEIPPAEAPLFIITTNYDSFIERAFREKGRAICVVTQDMRDPEKGASGVRVELPDRSVSEEESTDFQWSDLSRFPRDCAFLFKMHGSVATKRPQRDDVIITEDDYVDFLVNSGGRKSPYFPPPALTAQYKQKRFLFLGYSLYDWNFRAFLRILALKNALSRREQRRHWAIQLEPHQIEVDLWAHRNVNVFDGDLSDFCGQLSACWQNGAP